MRLIDSETAASALDVTSRTVRRMVASGLLVNHGTAKRIQLDISEVIRVSEQRTADVR